MKIKNKMFIKFISVLSAVSIASSCMISSVGAVNVAPSHVYSQSLVNKVNNLNNKLDGLTNALKSLQQKISGVRNMYVHIGDQYVIVPSNDETFEHIDVLDGRISGLIYFVDRIKGINTARNEAYVDRLSSYLDTVTTEIVNNANMSNNGIIFYNRTISKNILEYRKKISDLADKMIKNNNNNINPIDRINNNNNNNNNNNHNNNNHNNNIIINNINNNLNNPNWNLNDNDKMNAAVEITKIRDVISVLNNDQNIANNSAFAQNPDFKRTLDKFRNAFVGYNGIYSQPNITTRGLYPVIAKRWFKDDVNARGEYTGQYDALNRLYEAVVELSDAYVCGNDGLDAQQFRNKIKQKAQVADNLLNNIVDLLGIE